MDKFENEKNQIDAQLRQLQELKCIGLLASGIVHNFNNTLGVIHGYADLALRTASSNDSIKGYLKKIIEGTDAAKNLVEKMNTFARQKKPDCTLVSIHSIVEHAIKTYKESLPVPIDIEQDIDIMRGSVFADADQLQIAVIILCNNAYDAVCENRGIFKIILKEVNVGASFAGDHEQLNEGRYAKITVSDTGCGMEQNVLKKIYEPFFSTKNISENSGLGLSIVLEIIKGHKGEIIVESNLGEGTKFDIYLPLVN